MDGLARRGRGPEARFAGRPGRARNEGARSREDRDRHEVAWRARLLHESPSIVRTADLAGAGVKRPCAGELCLRERSG